MKPYRKFIETVIAVSAASYLLQLAWIHIAEPIMEACGVAFHGILTTGDLISGAAVVLIIIAGAVVLGVLFNGGIPIPVCLFYNVLYTVFLIIYSPGRIEYNISENFLNPFRSGRLCLKLSRSLSRGLLSKAERNKKAAPLELFIEVFVYNKTRTRSDARFLLFC